MKTSLRGAAIVAGVVGGILLVGCTVNGDGVTRQTPTPRPDDPSRIEDPFPSTAPVPTPDPTSPTTGGPDPVVTP